MYRYIYIIPATTPNSYVVHTGREHRAGTQGGNTGLGTQGWEHRAGNTGLGTQGGNTGADFGSFRAGATKRNPFHER